VFDDKENYDQEDKKKRAFVDADFLQPDGAHMNDDHTWLRRNDSFVSMSGVTQSTNNYVCNLSISPGEIPSLHEDFMMPRKRIRGANANNVGNLSCLISVYVNFLQNIIFYSSKTATTMRLMIMYVDVTESSPECTTRSVVNDPLSDLGQCSTVRSN
jgi:hypothetical protein